MVKKVLLVFMFLASFAFAKIDVSVSILPQKFFVEKIAKDLVNVNVIIPKSSDPHTFEPKPKEMVLVSKSKVYIKIGVPFEKTYIKDIWELNKALLVVDSSDGVEFFKSTDEDELDPHIWMSPKNVRVIARNTADALVAVDPKNSILYMRNLKQFFIELDYLEKYINESLSSLKNRSFIVFHPSFGYFAKEYNLEQLAIEIEGKSPKPQDLKSIISYAKNHNIKNIITSPEFSAKTVDLIANEVGAKVIKISPLEYNWIENIKKLTEAIKQ